MIIETNVGISGNIIYDIIKNIKFFNWKNAKVEEIL